MRAISKVLCVAAVASLQVLGRRMEGTNAPQLNVMDETRPGESLVETGSKWETVDTSFCITKEHEFGCDPDSIIKVITAYYSRARKLVHSGDVCEEIKKEGAADGCGPKQDKDIGDKCDGQQTCKFQEEDHKKCGFRTLRVKYQCEAAAPAADDDVAAYFATEGSMDEEVHEQQSLPNQEVLKQQPEQEVHTTSTSATTTPLQPLPEQEVTTSSTTTPLQPMADQEIISKQPLQDEEVIKQPAPPAKVKGTKGIHRNKAIAIPEDKEAEIKMDLCYRSSRTSKLWKHGIFHMWAGSTERLVEGCGEHEGCFKVKFESIWDGSEYWYEDPDPETGKPTQDELFEGDIEDTGFLNFQELMSTVWGLGIRRNDVWTWGVCLPKTKGVQFAVRRWDYLKGLHDKKTK